MLVALCSAAACSSDDSPLAPPNGDHGELDLTRFVAIGNSLTAGYMNGALYRSGQVNSFPALFARRAGVEIEQPLIANPGIASPGTDEGWLVLVSLSPFVLDRARPAGIPLNASLTRPYDNLGVPGARLTEALAAQTAATSVTNNGFFDLILRGQGTWAQQVAALDATFVTVWLGSNDVLGYAARGGDPNETPGLPTPPETFASVYRAFVADLLATTDQIALFNIPDVTSIPFMTTVPPYVVEGLSLEPVLDDDGRLIPLLGPDGPLDPFDLVTIAGAELILEGSGVPVSAGGTGEPLPDAVVLNVAEQTVAQAAVAAYNALIDDLASQHALVLVDVNALLRDLAAGGIVSDGEFLTTDLLTGQVFSLDAVHPTAKGNGLITNSLIEAVNAKFDSTIPLVATSELPGIEIPVADRGTVQDNRERLASSDIVRKSRSSPSCSVVGSDSNRLTKPPAIRAAWRYRCSSSGSS